MTLWVIQLDGRFEHGSCRFTFKQVTHTYSGCEWQETTGTECHKTHLTMLQTHPFPEPISSWTQTGQKIFKYSFEWGTLQMSNHRHDKLPVLQVESILPGYMQQQMLKVDDAQLQKYLNSREHLPLLCSSFVSHFVCHVSAAKVHDHTQKLAIKEGTYHPPDVNTDNGTGYLV